MKYSRHVWSERLVLHCESQCDTPNLQAILKIWQKRFFLYYVYHRLWNEMVNKWYLLIRMVRLQNNFMIILLLTGKIKTILF